MQGPLPGDYRLGSNQNTRVPTAVLFTPWRSTEGGIAWLGRSLGQPRSERREQCMKGSAKKRR